MTAPEPRHSEWMSLALAEARKALATADVPIGAVVIGPDGSVFDILRERRLNHWVEVIAGVREQECAALLREFFAGHRA